MTLHLPLARYATAATLALLALGACSRPAAPARGGAPIVASEVRAPADSVAAGPAAARPASTASSADTRTRSVPADSTASVATAIPGDSSANRDGSPSIRVEKRSPVDHAVTRDTAGVPTDRGRAADAASSTPPDAPPRAAPAATAASTPARQADRTSTAAPRSAAAVRPPLPFRAGERLEYDVRYGPFRVGRGVLELRGGGTIRNRPVFHALFTLRGGNRLISVNDSYQSWFDTLTLASLRYVQDIDQGPYERDRYFDIFPERQTFQERGKAEEPSVALPLDDASFIFFVRTLPLEVGRTYEFNRYFRPDRNPVRVRVLRRERVKVPAGTFDAIVVQPIIKSKGLFGEEGRAEVWFADDATRRVLQIKSTLSVGTVSMQLR